MYITKETLNAQVDLTRRLQEKLAKMERKLNLAKGGLRKIATHEPTRACVDHEEFNQMAEDLLNELEK